ncbi:Uncharacterised protein [Salmonella enterica subsp. arizonae]|uniref:Uncharacterized protein n=2 Tax=Salmonella enterica TaxID=28901 RepID=A0A3S4GRQ6_SALER|nr:hypothetical protein SED60170_24700 [Salmonella enterica subsp. diarizonae serovar 60:r:e,n,x,z15 str. 01-0170]SQI59838.1 Uncharacterised protein [Salmonella enterica subsp. diarizonae]SUG59292.1 Uncharacterised protein [Salmonella enterica subsp. arizonae]SUG54006.1 Uncharacterised protein [Salmonella enterica subsp. diarizonae]VEA75226.1 Uncharacterised protein [Salmonella enterica subsp. arizonae]
MNTNGFSFEGFTSFTGMLTVWFMTWYMTNGLQNYYSSYFSSFIIS